MVILAVLGIVSLLLSFYYSLFRQKPQCRNCGALVTQRDEVCPRCGRLLVDQRTDSKSK